MSDTPHNSDKPQQPYFLMATDCPACDGDGCGECFAGQLPAHLTAPHLYRMFYAQVVADLERDGRLLAPGAGGVEAKR